MSNISIYTEKLRESGLRPTRQRLKICEVLFSPEKTFHFTINDLTKIIEEIATTRTTERGGRADDKRAETAMEDRKKQGYF